MRPLSWERGVELLSESICDNHSDAPGQEPDSWTRIQSLILRRMRHSEDRQMRIGYSLKRLHDYGRAGWIMIRLNRHDRWTRHKLIAHQQRRLSAVVRYAAKNSQFYAELYRGIKTDGPVDLRNLPTVNKATMMEHFDRLVTDPRLRLVELQGHLQSLTRDEYYLGEYRVLATSGSSGVRGVFVFDRKAWCTVLAGSFRAGTMMGMSPRLSHRLRVAVITTESPTHASRVMTDSTDVGTVNVLQLHATSRVEELVEALNTFQPEVVAGFSSVIALLAIEQLEGRLDIHPQVVETGAEVRTCEMERNIREAWGIAPYDLYGTTECGAFNVDCSFHRGIHVFEDLWIAEVVDEQNRPVPDGSLGHRVLMTNLFNFTQPLIRYEVSDMLTMSTEPCPCGRPFRLIASVEGRSDDIIWLRGRQDRDVPVHPILFRDAIGSLPEVKEYCVERTDTRLSVTVVPRGEAWNESVVAGLTEHLRLRLESLGAICPEIEFQRVDRLERDPSKMGKLKLVKSNSSDTDVVE